ncbi:MAG: hypothetical protein IPL43_11570 [Micropruina sp.]|nr:hypothetical protein [Micropruina sp.]
MNAEEWVPFLYREFYDFPRAIVVELRGGRFMLDCPFDDALDDYPSEYRVLELAGDEPLDCSWVGLGTDRPSLGMVPRFAGTVRR